MAASPLLPNELILQIIKFASILKPFPTTALERLSKEPLVDVKEMRTHRLVSRHFNEFASSILFAELKLTFGGWAPILRPLTTVGFKGQRCLEVISALATRSTNAFKHTRKLRFLPQHLYRTSVEAGQKAVILAERELVIDRILDAVSALTNLRVLFYRLPPADDRLTISLFRALMTLPHFERLELNQFGGSWFPISFTVPTLSHLTTLHLFFGRDQPKYVADELSSFISRCPSINNIGITDLSPTKRVSIGALFAQSNEIKRRLQVTTLFLCHVITAPGDIETNIPHLRHLTCLHMEMCCKVKNSETNLGGFWTLLGNNNIHIKELAIDIVDDRGLLISYLASYSGLTRFSLRLQRTFDVFFTENQAEGLAQVFTKVLPKHSKTLRHLVIGSRTLSQIPELPTDKQFEGLLTCRYLSTLRTWVNCRPVLQDHDTTAIEKWLEICVQLPHLVQLDVHARSYGGYDESSWIRIQKEVVQKFKEKHGIEEDYGPATSFSLMTRMR